MFLFVWGGNLRRKKPPQNPIAWVTLKSDLRNRRQRVPDQDVLLALRRVLPISNHHKARLELGLYLHPWAPL
ncbi:hypothetical protein LSO12E_270001 [Candidatus Liberibacter solanacearum]